MTDPGDKFTAEVFDVSYRHKDNDKKRKGKARAKNIDEPQTNTEYILGVIDVEEGDRLDAIYLGGAHAISLEHTKNGVYTAFDTLRKKSEKIPVHKPDESGTLSEGDIITVVFDSHTNPYLGHAVGETDGYWVHLPVEQSFKFIEDSPQLKVRVVFKIGNFAIADFIEDKEYQDFTKREQSTEDVESKKDATSKEASTEQSNTTDDRQSVAQTVDNTSGSADTQDEQKNSESLQEKRKRALDAATESPEEEINRTSKATYTRSSAIRDYVKTRANGVCEYCEEPAPFNTSNGDPYLEAHHIDELSQGGEDHPDKVVALCPSCHMEIHYGDSGGEINQNLREKYGQE